MPTTEESTQSIGRSKAAIDNGFSRVGRTQSGDDKVAAWLHAAGGRAVATCDAIILLCREHHAPEAASLARAVIQLAADMRWIAGSTNGDRLAEFEKDAAGRDWGLLWSSPRLKERLASSGLPEPDAARWVEEAGKLCAGHLAGGSSGLPWAHAFGGGGPVRVPAEAVLAVTARAMDEAVRALEARWPGFFTA
ncbi:MAG: hypothetical protein HY925_02435 [Elusimicrobia bacterium]|nr:hypothetical protein [Elusimicrobiota bacterium]